MIEVELPKPDGYIANLRKLKEITDKFMNFTELTANMLNQHIDRIEIRHPEKINGRLTQEVNIMYRFIGSDIA